VHPKWLHTMFAAPRTARSAADLKCYVCGKQGCWSTKNSKEDRRKAYDRYKSDRNTRDKSKVTYNSFLAWYEGVDDGLDTDEEDSPVLQYLQSMGIDDDSSDNNEEQVPGPLHTSAFEMTAFLQNMSTRHLLTKEDPFRGFLATGAVPPACDDLTAMGDLFILTRYDEMEFHGLMPDTGAAMVSTGGQPQFRALQREIPSIQLDKAQAGKATVRFGPGQVISSIGVAVVPTPFGSVDFHVIPQNTPFLLCLADMDRLGVIFDNVRNCMVRDSLALPLTRKWGHAWLHLKNEKILGNGFLTEMELKRLHRRFGHPSVARLHKVLAAAGHESDRQILEAVV